MGILISLIVGAVGGYLAHSISMKVSFKQRTIDNKIKVYDSIIGHWVKMRNFIFHQLLRDVNTRDEFDKLYGESQIFIGEAVFVSEDDSLTEAINSLNERLVRTDWVSLSEQQINDEIEKFKLDALQVIKDMRGDVKKSTIFDFTDLMHIFSGFKPSKGDLNQLRDVKNNVVSNTQLLLSEKRG